MLANRRIARKAPVLKPHMRACALRGGLDGDDRLRPFCAALAQAISTSRYGQPDWHLSRTRSDRWRSLGRTDILKRGVRRCVHNSDGDLRA